MKRLLSILLALSLVISIIPAAFAADGEAYTETYSFTANKNSTLLNMTDYNAKNTDGDEMNNTNWYYFDAPEKIKELAGIAPSRVLFLFSSKGIRMHMNKDDLGDNKGNVAAEFSLALKAPADKGFYIPYATMYSAGKATLSYYIGPRGEGSTKHENYVGTGMLVATGSLVANDDLVTITGNNVIYSDAETELITAFKAGTTTHEFNKITFTKILTPTFTASVDGEVKITLNPKEIATASVKVSGTTDGTTAVEKPVANSFVTYYCEDVEGANVVTVDATNGTITANAAGTATVWAETSDGTESSKITVTVRSEDAALTEEFVQAGAGEDITDSYIVPTVAGLEIDGSVITPDSNGDGSYNLTAPETKGDKKFLYWAKGMETKKRIISFSNVLEKYVPDSTGITYLIAVYEGDITDTTNEYYNLNCQLIAKQENAPTEMPSIPGLGTAKGWDPCDDNIYVAEYADLDRDKVTVTVNGTEQTVAYGTEIPCTADAKDASGKPFKCWTKKGVNEEKAEIVSIDESYSFRAWEDCTIEAVYEDYYYTGSNMNILIDSFSIDTGVTGVMAEFIGFDSDDVDVVEKGIMFTATGEEAIKIPMTTTDNQLTVVADTGKYAGYAILRNGSAYTLITDGLYEHN